ncbi:unnamed protein product [Leptosia nina]|uniref:ribonuclease H n=1 Tax=Leptosia nina TaxID=320188 RepID=A0AAV1JWJ2_9NEOP
MEGRANPMEMPHPAHEPLLTYKTYDSELDLETQTDTSNFFTDGSKFDEGVGAAVVIFKEKVQKKFVKIKLASYCTVFQAEMVALHRAFELMEREKSPNINVCSDSRSALDDITSGRSLNPLAVQIRRKISKMREHKTITLFWIKAHAGHEGNERADLLAKEAAQNNKKKPDYDLCPISTIKRLIRTESAQRWEEDYQNGETASIN